MWVKLLVRMFIVSMMSDRLEEDKAAIQFNSKSLKGNFSRVGVEGEEGGVTGLARVQRLEDYRRKARFKQVLD